jgi:hypothetical protein
MAFLLEKSTTRMKYFFLDPESVENSVRRRKENNLVLKDNDKTLFSI